ncbi:hypothetical protein NIES46_12040 [Arthrospira platensis NIES-46]|uniref:GmrSD restriction endonucleases N-terminal domain-containing protein n=1 Tax=Limnospira platensis NIES-46 TaxID=1236695 RepID=A0A5M3T3Z5_LIMPL|nr:DUF262 domain-containing protein [Arthrospira platensis]GCE93155.1 hypothetical protein NIES46_12040 [Arthrospira platensis NIES-46]
MPKNSSHNLEDSDEELLTFKYSITSYGADYPVDSLVKRMKNGSIYVPTFQRGYVWDHREASRFIESLLLGLPVPGIFLAKEQDTQKLLVIDGQQRLKTIQYFYDGVFEPNQKEFSLTKVAHKFDGLTYQTLSEEDRRRLDDSIIPATIVKQDEPSDDNSSIYYIFERLNTGGQQLKPQEIRACIYHGEFNNLLAELNYHQYWRDIYGSPKPDKRMRDQEMILRFLALYFEGDNYQKPMKGFLNDFIGKNRHLHRYDKSEIQLAFIRTIETAYDIWGVRAFKPKNQINAAVFDCIMVGLARRLEKGSIKDKESLDTNYQNLFKSQNFLDVTVNSSRTTEKSTVEKRLEQAINAFKNVQ